MSPKESCYLSDVKQLANTVDLAQTGVGLSVHRLIASNNIFDRTSLILVNYKRQEWLFVPRETQDWNLSTIQTILRHSFDFDPQTWSLNANCPLESDRFALTGSLKAQCRRCWRHQWYDTTSHFCCCTKEPMRHLRVSQPIFACRMCMIFATWDRRAEMKSHFVTSEYVSLLPIQLRVDLVHALYGELIMLIACLCVIRGRRNHGDYCSRRCTVSTVARTYPRDTHLKTLFWSTAGRG